MPTIVTVFALCLLMLGHGALAEQVTLQFWRPGTDALTKEYYDAAIARFQAQNPDIRIVMTEIPWGDEFETKLNVGFATGTAPDVMHYSLASVAARASRGQYLELSRYYQAWDGKDDFLPAVYESGTYQDGLYGIGFGPDPRVFAWRKSYFAEAGLNPDQPPATWEELAEFARKTTRREGGVTTRSGFDIALRNGYQLWQIFALQNGTQLYDPVTLRPSFNSPAGAEALAFLTELVQENVHIPFDQHQSQTNPFTAGNATMSYVNPNHIQDLLATNPELEPDLGVAPPLSRVRQATFAGMGLFFIPSTTRHPDEAWKFIEFMMSEEEMWRRFVDRGWLPVRESLHPRLMEAEPLLGDAAFQAVATGEGVPKTTWGPLYLNAVSQAVEQAYYGQQDPASALDDAVRELNREIDLQGLL